MNDALEIGAKAIYEASHGNDSWRGATSSARRTRRDIFTKTLAALDAARYVIVPMYPTQEMIEAAHTRLAGDGDVRDIYRAMIFAAPKVVP